MPEPYTGLTNWFFVLRVYRSLTLVNCTVSLVNQGDILATIFENFLSFNFESIEHLKLRHGLNDETYVLFNAQTNLQALEIWHESLHLNDTILNL